MKVDKVQDKKTRHGFTGTDKSTLCKQVDIPSIEIKAFR